MRYFTCVIIVCLLLLPSDYKLAQGLPQSTDNTTSSEYPELNSPYRLRAINDTYVLAEKALRNGDREAAMNLVNRNPDTARFVLIRLLRAPETAELGRQFGLMFATNSDSELEGPLVDFLVSIQPDRVGRVLDSVETASKAAFFLRQGDWIPSRVAEALQDLQSARSFFKTIGFRDGDGFCARILAAEYARNREMQNQQTAKALYEDSLSIFESARNTRGEIACLLALSNVDADNTAKHKERALALASSSQDSMMIYRSFSNNTTQKNEFFLETLQRQPGLKLTRYENLLETIDLNDVNQRRSLVAGLERESDPVVAVSVGVRLFLRMSFKGTEYDDEAAALFDHTISLAEELGYDTAAFAPSLGLVPAVPNFFWGRGDIQKNRARLSRAEASYQAALDYMDDVDPKFSYMLKLRQELLNDLGALYAQEGDLPKSLDRISQAMAIAEHMDPEGAGASRALLSLAMVQAQMGDLHSAEKELRNGARIHFAGRVNQSLLALAEIHLQFGRYEEAVRDLEDMEPEFTAMVDRGVKDGNYGSRLRLLALAWLRIGDFAKAEEFARQYDQSFSNSSLSGGASVWLTERGILGIVLTEAQKYQAAEAYFKERFARAAKIAGARESEEANALKGLGRVYRLGGRGAEAIDPLSKALEKYRALSQRRDEMEVRLELGHIALDSHRQFEAAEHFNLALALAEEAHSPQGKWSAHASLAGLARSEGKLSLAIEHLESAVTEVESVSSWLNQDLIKSTFVDNKIGIYNDLLRVLNSSGRDKEALEYAQRRRAQSFAESARNEGNPAKSPVDGVLLQSMAAVQDRLIGKQKALEDQFSSTHPDPEFISTYEKELIGIRDEHTDLRRRLQQEYPFEASRQGFTRPLTLAEIQNDVLKTGDVLVDYLVTDKEVFAFVITRGTFKLVPLTVRRNILADEIQRLRKPFDRVRLGDTEVLHMDKFDVNLASQLYQQLLAPLGPAVKESRRLIILPDDVLHYLPFECLVTSAPMPAGTSPAVKYDEYRDIDWLIKLHSVIYGMSIESLRPDFRQVPAPTSILAMANPARSSSSSSSSPISISNALPGSEVEASSVAKILSQSHITAKVLTGVDAREIEFNREGPDAGYIHLAVHAVLNERQPYYSALMLSPDKETDGWLQPYEISKMRLTARLVTLSGCDTGLGKLYKGEGLMGLRRAFLLAGAQSVLVSLWSVEDSIANPMEEFYRNIGKGQPLSEALKNAKVQYMGKTAKLSGTTISLSHPFFWAPFTLASTSLLQ